MHWIGGVAVVDIYATKSGSSPLVLQTIAAIMPEISTWEDRSMGAFIAACLAFIVLGAGGYFVLNEVQQPAGTAFSTGAVRIDPGWSWRVANGSQSCEPRESWQWFWVDFHGESAVCSDSQ